MKTFDDCLLWMKSIEEYRQAAPEGVYMAKNDRVVTLRDVDPVAIQLLHDYFQETPVPYTIERLQRTTFLINWRCQLDGRIDGEYYTLTITRGFGEKIADCAYRFFYRKVSDRVRRESYDYTF